MAIIKEGKAGHIKGNHGMKSFSDRSGQPFPYKDMVYEPDTKVWLHRSENDGRNNRIALAKRKRVFIDADTPIKSSKRLPDDPNPPDDSWPTDFY